MKLMLLSVFIGIIAGGFSYNPRGWRPLTPSFLIHDSRSRFKGCNNSPSSLYGPPNTYLSPSATITPSTTGSKMVTTPITTTPRSKEPTTPSNIEDEDEQVNPALAIANSFAFNRPVYIYTGFPFDARFAYVQ